MQNYIPAGIAIGCNKQSQRPAHLNRDTHFLTYLSAHEISSGNVLEGWLQTQLID
jgi:hypothetical protein